MSATPVSSTADEAAYSVTASERLLRPDQVAAVFNVSPRTVTYWAAIGRFPSVRTPGGQYRFRRADVDAQLAADQKGPAGAVTPDRPEIEN